MRLTRWLIPVAILCILIWVGVTYAKRKATLAHDAPKPPAPLELGVEGRANDWVYTQSDGSRPKVTVRAKSFRQIEKPSTMELHGVQLQLFNQDGTQYDLVTSASANFDIASKSLYSDGQVEITMNEPVDGPRHGRLVKIHTSGVKFESDTGKAATDRLATFDFDQGGGSAVGADYDPQSRELHMRSQVVLDWRGKDAGAIPMHVEAGEAYYRERDSKVTLMPWSKLTRGTLHMEAGMSLITLEDGEIKEAGIANGRGVQDDPGRKVEFSANDMVLHFGDGMLMQKIEGHGNGKLISTASSMRTSVNADNLFLDFDPNGKESVMTTALAMGKSVAEAVPLPRPGAELAETRVLRSEVIHLKMRPGGKDIENVETDGAGTLDFLPNRPTQAKRFMKGDRIWITYAPDNRIQSFRSIEVTTRTEKPPVKGLPSPPSVTSSKELTAAFDPATSELTHLEQKTNFKYEEGTRRAVADRATLEQQKDLMNLDGSAKVWDPTGSAAGDHITMNQKSGDFTVEGHVASTRMPDRKGNSSAMLANDEIMQARAQRMVATDSNTKIHYEGNAVAWQGSNRVQADTLDIDRERQIMEAHGKVVSQFIDRPKADKPDPKTGVKPAPKANAAAPASPVFTIVHAPDLIYTDETRIAYYKGGVTLSRPGLDVVGKEIHAYLKDSSSDSSLDKAFADGAVKIVSTADNRSRTGTSDHAEYYADENKLILVGGDPLMVDSLKGQTRGKQLTWFSNNDRLLVNGVESRPADSLLRKK